MRPKAGPPNRVIKKPLAKLKNEESERKSRECEMKEEAGYTCQQNLESN